MPRSRSQHDLVNFDRPPVAEVALTVQFAQDVADLDVFAQFASAVKDELPVRETQPVLLPMSETFGVLPLAPPVLRFDPPFTSLPRTWFLSADQSELVQLQSDRLSFNWRRTTDDMAPYPRYSALRKKLARYLTILERSVTNAGQSLSDINMCEVSYVNPIEAGKQLDGSHSDLSQILRLVRSSRKGRVLGKPEDAQLQARWRIPGDQLATSRQEPAGRLYLSATPGFKPPDNVPIYMVNLVGRVMPSSPTRRAANVALDVAHRWVVLGFEDITTDRMHDAWGHRGS